MLVFVVGFVVVGALGAPAAVEAPAVPRAKYFGSRFRAAKRGWSARRRGAFSGRVLVIIYLSRLGWWDYGGRMLFWRGCCAFGGGDGRDARGGAGAEDGV